jgi:hypothetical protein
MLLERLVRLILVAVEAVLEVAKAEVVQVVLALLLSKLLKPWVQRSRVA